MKRFITLTEDQQQELKSLLKSTTSAKIQRRLQFIEMRAGGKKNTEIIPIIHVSMETLRDWTGIFLRDGFTGLCSLRYSGRRPGKLMEQRDQIKKHVEEHLVSNLTSLQNWIYQELSISVQTSWLGVFLKKNSIILTRK